MQKTLLVGKERILMPAPLAGIRGFEVSLTPKFCCKLLKKIATYCLYCVADSMVIRLILISSYSMQLAEIYATILNYGLMGPMRYFIKIRFLHRIH